MKRLLSVLVAWFLLCCWSVSPLVGVFALAGESPGARLASPIEDPDNQAPDGVWLLSREALEVRVATRNSTIVATLTAILVTAVSLPAGYALGARMQTRTSVLSGLVLGRALPSCAIVMPILGVCLAFGVNGSLWILAMLHAMLTLPLMVALFARQPWDRLRLLEQSAYLDGAGMLRVKTQVWTVAFLPTFTFGFILAWLTSWNEFGFAVMLMSGDSTTLPVIMTGYETIRGVDWGKLTMILLVATLPSFAFVLVIAALARRFWQGRDIGTG